MKTLLLPLIAGSMLAQTPAIEINRRVDEALAKQLDSLKVRLDGQTMTFVSGMNVGPTVTGAPYSAEAVNETIQVLSDGNRIVDRHTTKVYRDGQGRERRETGDIVMISDPVAQTSYTLNTAEKTVSKTTTNGRKFVFTSGPNSTRVVTAGRGSVLPRTGSGPVQALGSRVIEGVPATGTRSVTTIPAGQIGNEKPIEVVDEEWYSGELQLIVMTRHADPRSGETTYKLTNIKRADPQRSLFEAPSDYKETQNFRFVTPAKPAAPVSPAKPVAPAPRRQE